MKVFSHPKFGLLLLVLLLVAIAAAVFPFSPWLLPRFDSETDLAGRTASSRGGLIHGALKASNLLLRKATEKVQAEILETQQAAADRLARTRVVTAFYDPAENGGLQSLQTNAPDLTHFLPRWVHLSADGKNLDFQSWDPVIIPHNMEALTTARRAGLQILPVLDNYIDGEYRPEPVRALFQSPTRQQLVAHALRKWLVQEGFHGVTLEFANLEDAALDKLPAFIKLLHQELKRSKLNLVVVIGADDSRMRLKQILQFVDFFLLKAFGEHNRHTGKGPLAGIGWYTEVLKRFRKILPPRKLVIGLGSFAEGWGSFGSSVYSYPAALELARRFKGQFAPRQVLTFDQQSLNLTFKYEDGEGQTHEVWLLDGVSFYNQWLLALRAGVRGVALSLLGQEDPSVWNVLKGNSVFTERAEKILREIPFIVEISFKGKGEIMAIHSTPVIGERTILAQNSSGLITNVQYDRYPAPFVITRAGYVDKAIALTFDDGPDPTFTPLVLDELKRMNVPATFFIVGRNAARYPALLARMWNEGHEIGSHTFTHVDMSSVPEQRREFELDASQKVIQRTLHHATRLFRSPYNSDAMPSNGQDLLPLLTASRLNYVIVAGFIDPQDWNLGQHAENGWKVTRDPADIAGKAVKMATALPGNIIVLHDGGGNRWPTVQALPLLVQQLRQQGFRFVTISQLLNVNRDRIMPPVEQNETQAKSGLSGFAGRVLAATIHGAGGA